MPTPQQLEVAAHSLIAVLGLWLGLTVLTRSRALPSRVFTVLSLALVVWSAAIILQRLSSSASAVHTGRSIEEMAAAVIVPATAHLSLAIATEGHPTIGRRRVIAVLYVLSVLFALPGIFTDQRDPGRRPELQPWPGPRRAARLGLEPLPARDAVDRRDLAAPGASRGRARPIHAGGSSRSRSPR